MKKIAGRKKADDTKIDLTPMLDVVFILLIFFVVTATFLSETAISAASSDNNNNEPPPESDDKKNILCICNWIFSADQFGFCGYHWK